MLQCFNLFNRANGAGLIRVNAFAGVFQHCQRVQRNIRAGPGVRGRRQVIGVGFAGDFKNGHGDFISQLRTAQEPLSVSPRLHNLFGVGIACLGFLFYIVEIVKHQQGVGQRFRGDRRQFCVVQRVNQGMNVVTALHGAQQFDSFFTGNQWRSCFAFGDRGKESGFNIGGFVDARRYAVN